MYHNWLTLTSGETNADGLFWVRSCRYLFLFSRGSHPLASPSLEFPLLKESASVVVWLLRNWDSRMNLVKI